jgi:hypothetical protein
MTRAGKAKLLLLAGAAVVAITACGGADNGGLPTVTTTTTSIDTDTADSAGTDSDMEDGEHDHDAAPDAVAWDGAEIPEVQVVVTGDPESGWDIAATITGFTFTSPSQTDHVPGEGHTHVFVDGRLMSMSYEPIVHVDDLDPGEHQAMVTLSRNDHTDYSLNDELIMAMATFTVPGVAETADANIKVMYMSGIVSGVEGRPAFTVGDTIEITIHSDVAGMVHIHGYDRFLDLDDGEMDTVRFTADIPGIFEVEFEDSGVLLFEFQVS